MKTTTKTICLNQISKCFGNTKVLSDISFSVSKGEIFGLLGPSGAGKTTIIKILTGQLLPSSGQAFVMDYNCNKLPREAYQKIGIMMDHLGLYERLSVYDNLAFFAKIQHVHTSKITSVLETVGLSEARKTTVSKLSKGMKNRVCLARAILTNCDILFLDEPTSGLDPTTANSIHELIKAQKEKGCTIFMTTHNMDEATHLCDHVALLHSGKIIEYGTPKEICLAHNAKNTFTITLKSGQTLELLNTPHSAKELCNLMEDEQILSIHSSEPKLKDVFLHLAGGNFNHEL